MDPAVAIPLQFTIQAVGLAAAGLLVTWAVVERLWPAVVGGGILAAAQAVFTAQLVVPADAAWHLWSGLRLVGLALVVVSCLTVGLDRALLAAGGLSMGAGATWAWATDGVPLDLAGGARTLLAVGAVLLGVWAWRRSAGIRQRIVYSLVAVLGVAVVVAGGAVLRVATSDALVAAEERLTILADLELERLRSEAASLSTQGAVTSALIAVAPSTSEAVIEIRERTLADRSFAVLVDHARTLEGPPDLEPGETEPVATSPAVTSALEAQPATAIVRVGGGAALIAATPVFSPPQSRAATDVAWALVIGQRLTSDRLERIAESAGTGARVVLIAEDRELLGSRRRSEVDEPHGLRVEVPVDTTAGPRTSLVVSRPVASVAGGASSLPRALVGGLLSAALLAVVAAAWVSARLTRPVMEAMAGAERAKSQFLDSVSHELRTPLTPIRGYTSLLREDRGRRGAYLDEIDDAAERLERIVTLLVDVAAVQAGRYTVRPEPLDGRELVLEVAGRWKSRAPSHQVDVRAPKSLPKVHGDRVGIQRVLDELVDNAVKFSPEGGTVRIAARKMGSDVEFSVTDEGIGLDPEQVEGLSAAFVQAEGGPTRRFGGLGLGLTYAAGVLAAHGTALGVRGESGEGCRFAFTLPTRGMVSRMPDRARAT